MEVGDVILYVYLFIFEVIEKCKSIELGGDSILFFLVFSIICEIDSIVWVVNG